LADHEYLGTGIGHRGFFAQDAQVGDLAGDPLRVGDGIGVRDPHQREQTGLDLADDLTIHAHARVTDALQNRPHQAPAPRSPSSPESPESSESPASPESVTSPESASLPGALAAPARAAPPATGSNAGCTAPTGSPCPRTGTRSQSHSPSTPRARSAPASSTGLGREAPSATFNATARPPRLLASHAPRLAAGRSAAPPPPPRPSSGPARHSPPPSPALALRPGLAWLARGASPAGACQRERVRTSNLPGLLFCLLN